MTIQTRRDFLKSTLATGVALGAAGGLSSAAFAASSMTYLTPFGFLIDYAETMYGQTSGIFEKHGVTLRNEGGRGSAMAIQQLTAGNVLVARTGGTDLMKAFAKETSLVAFASMYPKDLFWVISSEKAPVRDIKELEGKTVGVVSVGGATENLLDMMLAKAGIDPKSVRREAVGTAPAAFELVEAGRISAYISTGLTVFLLQQAKKPVVAWSVDESAPSPGDLYVTTKKAVAEQPEVLVNFLRGVHETLGAIVTGDSREIIASMSKTFDLAETKRPDGGVQGLDFAKKNFKLVHDLKLKPEASTFKSAHELMVKANIIKPLADESYLDMSIWQKAFG